MQVVDIESIAIDTSLIGLFPAKSLTDACALPLYRQSDRVVVAIVDGTNFAALDELTAFSGLLLEPVIANEASIRNQRRQLLGVGGGVVGSANGTTLATSNDDVLQQALDSTENASIVRFTFELLKDACHQGASDIHIEPEDTYISIRFRIDGVLRVQSLPAEIHSHRDAIVSRFKILSKLNIAESDCRKTVGFQFEIEGRSIDIRTSIVPMKFGEGLVLRILDRGRVNYSMENLGFPTEIQPKWNRLIRRSSGMILVTGPTGSGKTTTLYGSVATLRSPDLKIITIEDPIESR